MLFHYGVYKVHYQLLKTYSNNIFDRLPTVENKNFYMTTHVTQVVYQVVYFLKTTQIPSYIIITCQAGLKLNNHTKSIVQ